uniref:Reverse transcriptase domain-containing protein n=1 Tax=Tanacetum cinerariifolium TaxID=118510 RepID=A0A6L2NLL7_TANCI|nr:hypothetical protein [Tanacetum cinerariifolium]
MARTNVGRRGGGGRGRGLSNHEAARGVQKSIQTNTSRTCYATNANTSGTHSETNANTSGTCSEINANISSNTWIQKSVHTNTSRTHYETNANTSGSRSETNTWVQKSIRNNTSGTLSETNATMSSDTGVQEPVGEDELNTDVSQRQKGSNIIEKVSQDPTKRTMISLDGGEFTDPKVVRKITSILKTMFNVFLDYLHAAYNGALVEKYRSYPANHPIYDDDLWKKCAGDDMKGGVFNVRSTIHNYLDSVRGELKEELKEEVKVDLKKEMKVDLKEEMKADLKEEIKNELKEEMHEELKEEMRKEFKEEMRAKIQDMLVDYGIKSCVTHQTKTKQVMSDASSAVTYTSVYSDSEPWRYYEEDSAETGPPRVIVYGYDRLPIQPVAPPSPDYMPGPEHPPSLDYPLPANASPIAASPDYVADSDLEEEPNDDQADYRADGGDGDDEPFDDDDDDDTDDEDPEEEPFEDEEDVEEEEEHLASADSSAVPFVDPVLPAGDAEALEADEPTHAPRSPIINPFPRHVSVANKRLFDLSHPCRCYRAAGIRMRSLLPSTYRSTDIPEADMPPRKRVCLTTPAPGFEVRESCTAGATRQPGLTKSNLRRYRVEQAGYGITDTWDEIVDTLIEIDPTTLEGVKERVTKLDTTVRDRPNHRRTTMLIDREAMYAREAWAYTKKMAPKKRTTRATPANTTTPTTTITNAQLQALINRGVASALAKRDADRSMNGDNSNDLGKDGRRQMTTPRECTYTDFLKCQPMSFQGTEGVVGLTRWLEKNESIFQISNCTITCQVKFVSCTLQGSALTWWNSHMRAIGQDVAYAMPWAALKRMITDK